jgi:hypothetical protein
MVEASGVLSKIAPPGLAKIAIFAFCTAEAKDVGQRTVRSQREGTPSFARGMVVVCDVKRKSATRQQERVRSYAASTGVLSDASSGTALKGLQGRPTSV